MKKIILLILLFSLSATSYVSAQSQQTQKERFQSTYNYTKSLVNSQVYNFVGDVVFDGNTREKLNEGTNTIVINESDISGKLISLQSENKSFDITGTIENYTVVSDDDTQQVLVQFKIKSAAQTLDANIEIKPNGNSVLTVSFSNNNSITWVGKLKS